MGYVRKFFALIHLYVRWMIRSAKEKFKPKKAVIITVDSLEFVYLNLDHRKDRKIEIEGEFDKLGIKKFQRFAAIKNKNGALGCALSHKSILDNAKFSLSPVVVCEDDALFVVNRNALDKIVSSFYNDSRLDVLCLAYNEFNKVPIGKKFYISSDIQTMACYLAKKHVLDDFCKVAELSVKGLSSGGEEERYAIDQVWKELQKKYFFALPVSRAVIQRPSYSDIREKEVYYGL